MPKLGEILHTSLKIVGNGVDWAKQSARKTICYLLWHNSFLGNYWNVNLTAKGRNSIKQVPGCFDRLINTESANEWLGKRVYKFQHLFWKQKNELITRLFWAECKVVVVSPGKTYQQLKHVLVRDKKKKYIVQSSLFSGGFKLLK